MCRKILPTDQLIKECKTSSVLHDFTFFGICCGLEGPEMSNTKIGKV